MDVVGVSRARTSGSYVTKSGKKAYRGERKHWYVYFYDENGKFSKRMISAIEVPYYGSLIRRTKTYLCKGCGTRFRSVKAVCPKCGSPGVRVEKGTLRPHGRASLRKSTRPGTEVKGWTYTNTFTVEAEYHDAPTGQS